MKNYPNLTWVIDSSIKGYLNLFYLIFVFDLTLIPYVKNKYKNDVLICAIDSSIVINRNKKFKDSVMKWISVLKFELLKFACINLIIYFLKFKNIKLVQKTYSKNANMYNVFC